MWGGGGWLGGLVVYTTQLRGPTYFVTPSRRAPGIQPRTWPGPNLENLVMENQITGGDVTI